jgi:PqqD family protein of HPr-rel-A system
LSKPYAFRASREFAWRRLDDRLVVYDEATGDTHLLTEAAADVLLALLDRPAGLDAAELARVLAASAWSNDGDDGAARQAGDVLDRLAALGLVVGDSR